MGSHNDFTLISEEEINKYSVLGNLPDRPSYDGTYGEDGMTSDEVKACFDALPRLIIDYFNAFVSSLENTPRNEEEVCAIVNAVETGVYDGHTLRGFFTDIVSGALSRYLSLGEESLSDFCDKVYRSFTAVGLEEPSGATPGEVGKFYAQVIDGNIKELFVCTAFANSVYTWTKLTIPKLSQSVGESEDHVMSQKATTDALRAAEVGDVVRPVTNLIKSGNFSLSPIWDYWAFIRCSRTVTNGVLTVTGDGTSESFAVKCSTRITFNANQRFAFHYKVRVLDDSCLSIRSSFFGGRGLTVIDKPQKDEWYDFTLDKSFAASDTQWALNFEAYYADAATANGKKLEVKEVMLFDLSHDFGLGVGDTVPIGAIDMMVKRNGYWEGTKLVAVYNVHDNQHLNGAYDGYRYIQNHVSHARKRAPTVTFVLDDGRMADFSKIRPISERYTVPFTTAIFHKSEIPLGQILYLQNKLGWEVSSHAYNHISLDSYESEKEIEAEFLRSKTYFTENGITCDTLVYPMGDNDERVRRIAKKYFKCGATASKGSSKEGINDGVVASFYLKRFPFGAFSDNETLALHKAKVDEAISCNGWLIYMLHPANSEHTAEKTEMLAQLIEYIQSKGVAIKTLSDAYEDFANVIEVGDYIGGTQGIAISADGQKKNI